MPLYDTTKIANLPRANSPPMVDAVKDHIASVRRERFAEGVPVTSQTPLFPNMPGRWTDPVATGAIDRNYWKQRD